MPAIIGTALMTLIMTIAAVPFGAITAIYLAEYASEKSVFAKTIRFAVKTLAVVPSIIFGLFGLGFFVKFIGFQLDNIFYGGALRWGQPNILWASLTMALLTLPVVIVSVEEAIRTIPQDMREASLALASRPGAGPARQQGLRRGHVLQPVPLPAQGQVPRDGLPRHGLPREGLAEGAGHGDQAAEARARPDDAATGCSASRSWRAWAPAAWRRS